MRYFGNRRLRAAIDTGRYRRRADEATATANAGHSSPLLRKINLQYSEDVRALCAEIDRLAGTR